MRFLQKKVDSIMLNLKRIFLTILIVVYIIYVAVFNNKMSNQKIISNSNELTSKQCYEISVKDGLKLSYDDYIMICSVVQGETAGASLEWSELVAEVIKNRIQSSEFPDTVYKVLTQPNQFDAIQNYYNGIDINLVTYQAVTNVFANKDYLTAHRLDGATYYCNPDILDDSIVAWFDDNLTTTYDAYYYSNGYTYHHVFYK